MVIEPTWALAMFGLGKPNFGWLGMLKASLWNSERIGSASGTTFGFMNLIHAVLVANHFRLGYRGACGIENHATQLGGSALRIENRRERCEQK
jgi:hypothetical protein